MQKQIRFVTYNYSNLQGLKAVPIGVCLFLVSLWANNWSQPARNLTFPVIISLASLLAYLWIQRYYSQTFGRVQRTSTNRAVEWLFGSISGILGLGAFFLDVYEKSQVSALGIVFAINLLGEYLRMNWNVRGRFLKFYPLLALFVFLLSILPILGITDIWGKFGIVSPVYGVPMLMGVLTIVSGFFGHFFLMRALPHQMEENNV